MAVMTKLGFERLAGVGGLNALASREQLDYRPGSDQSLVSVRSARYYKFRANDSARWYQSLILLRAARFIREIAKLLKNNEEDREFKHFYIRLMAHCLMIRNYVNRNQAAVVPDNEFIIRTLVLFRSITMYVLQELSQISVSYARLRALNQYWNKMRDKDGSIKIKCTRCDGRRLHMICRGSVSGNRSETWS